MRTTVKGLKIVGACIFCACLYGVILDQITARICLAYFTEFHPNIGLPHDPTIVGMAWGLIATWWVGAALGGLLALACLAGPRPKLNLLYLCKRLIYLFIACAAGALIFGCIGYKIGMPLSPYAFPDSGNWPWEERSRFMADLFAHNASYFIAFVGGVLLILFATKRRVRLAKANL